MGAYELMGFGLFVLCMIAFVAFMAYAVHAATARRSIARYAEQPDGTIRCELEPRSLPHRIAWLFARAQNQILRHVYQGEVMPRGYGLAWMCYDAPYAIFMPIPLNLLARGVRAAWLWVKRGGLAIPSQAAEAYAKGRRDERAAWTAWSGDPLG